MTEQERYRGALLGLATGDAIGTTIEFMPPGQFKPVTDMAGGGPFDLGAGQWTDDTSMALCLADSLVQQRGFDPTDQLTRYVRWWDDGYMSSTGRCFDIGGTTRSALAKFQMTGEPYCGPTSARAAGNGSLMRLAPVPLFFARNPEVVIVRSGESSRTTHGATTCVDACRYFGGLIAGAAMGVDKDTLLATHYSPLPGYWQEHPLCPEIDEIAAGSFKRKSPPEIRGTGFVVDCLEAALWAFYHASDFRDGCLKAVNLGDDADTTGAVYGQIAGTYYGESGIPQSWRAKLAMRETIETLADNLLKYRVSK